MTAPLPLPDDPRPSAGPQSLCEFRDLEPGSDEEVALRGDWLSRLMFGWMLPADLAYSEKRSYEEWLTAQGCRLV